jgi:hypothetical protein
VHILENNPLHASSPKVDHVRSLLGNLGALEGTAVVDRVRSVLADHTVPPGGGGGGETGARPIESLAACVHTDDYGTRSSTLIRVPVATDRRPQVLVADGHPCTAPWSDVTALFDAEAPR